jgi:D-sedoheptulose 7-phosphate isomerase
MERDVSAGARASAARDADDARAAVRAHLDVVAAALAQLDLARIGELVGLLEATRRGGGTVFTCGNGGSATTASHFAADLVKGAGGPGRAGVRAFALGDNPALLTAWANDLAYARAFAEPLRALARPGDVLVAISTSGESANVVAAAEVARGLGVRVVALTGRTGGRLRGLADLHLAAACERAGEAEDVHLAVCHAVTAALKAAATPAAVARGNGFHA